MKRRIIILLLAAVILSSLMILTACNTSGGIVANKHVGASPMDGHTRFYVIVENADGSTTRYVARTEGVFDSVEIGDEFVYNPTYWLLDGYRWQKHY